MDEAQRDVESVKVVMRVRSEREKRVKGRFVQAKKCPQRE